MNKIKELLEEEKNTIIEEKKLERLIAENDVLIHNFLTQIKLDKDNYEKYKVIFKDPFMEYHFLRLAQEFLLVIDKNIPDCGIAIKGSMLFDMYDNIFAQLFIPINDSMKAIQDALIQERLYGTKVTLTVNDATEFINNLEKKE